jgi:hypothetical protein
MDKVYDLVLRGQSVCSCFHLAPAGVSLISRGAGMMGVPDDASSEHRSLDHETINNVIKKLSYMSKKFH